MTIHIIAAVADNGVIGNNGTLPWDIPRDLRRFREITTRQIVIMGRKTHESIMARLGYPLPDRISIVLSSDAHYAVPVGMHVAPNFATAVNICGGRDGYVIGGSSVYAEALTVASVMHLTHVHQSPEGDAFFPKVDYTQWAVHDTEELTGFSFVEYHRRIP